MAYWLTSDTHFGHNNIIKHCNRPFKDVNEMDNVLINNWNGIVKPNDTVLFLGDFAWSKEKYYKSRLNGNIIHISGNHDKNILIQDLILLKNKTYFHVAHKPEDCYSEYNLCGHVHEKWKVKRENGKLWINVGVDVWDYRPISFKEVFKIIK